MERHSKHNAFDGHGGGEILGMLINHQCSEQWECEDAEKATTDNDAPNNPQQHWWRPHNEKRDSAMPKVYLLIR